uniref:Rho-GAP domain-containing protein n=1 Tax=Romanomermis culicivorax TaxID=13658 RepID=A0A915J161_ROMCU
FLIDSFNLVYHSLKSEGLFRKSSNASRVKNLKQFFRQIQEPLLTYELEPQFFKFRSMQHEPTQVRYILELCHVLPPIHRETLAFLMRKLKHRETDII